METLIGFATLLNLVVFPVVYFLFKNVKQVRENHLKHLEESIAELRDEIDEVKSLVLRVDDKMTRHLEDHVRSSHA